MFARSLNMSFTLKDRIEPNYLTYSHTFLHRVRRTNSTLFLTLETKNSKSTYKPKLFFFLMSVFSSVKLCPDEFVVNWRHISHKWSFGGAF